MIRGHTNLALERPFALRLLLQEQLDAPDIEARDMFHRDTL